MNTIKGHTPNEEAIVRLQVRNYLTGLESDQKLMLIRPSQAVIFVTSNELQQPFQFELPWVQRSGSL